MDDFNKKPIGNWMKLGNNLVNIVVHEDQISINISEIDGNVVVHEDQISIKISEIDGNVVVHEDQIS
jgi:hypothetical protein